MGLYLRSSSLANTNTGLTIQGTALSYAQTDGNFMYLLSNMSGSSIRITGSTGIVGDLSLSGNLTLGGNFLGTASWADNAVTASYVSASNIGGTVSSASYAGTASYALNANIDTTVFLTTSSFNTWTGSSSSAFLGTSSYANNASQSLSASYALSSSQANSASYALSSSQAYSASYALSSSYAYSASYSLSSSYALSSSYSLSSSYALSASYALSSSQADSSSYSLSSSYALSSSQANSASYALSSSYAFSSSYALSSSQANSSSYALSSSQANSSSYSITASYAANAGNSNTYYAGDGIKIGTNNYITASVRKVNGIEPDPITGNITTTFAAIKTGTSASLYASSSGAITASIPDGLVWIITADSAANNGDLYIYASASVGQWYQGSTLDTAAADARYLQLTPQQSLSGSLSMGGKDITNVGYISASNGFTGSLLGTASYATTASYASNAAGLAGGSANYITLWSGSSQLTTSSIYQTGSDLLVGTTTYNNYKLDVSGSARVFSNLVVGPINAILTDVNYGIRVNTPMSGAASVFGIAADGDIQSGSTTAAYYFRSYGKLTAPNATLTSSHHFFAGQSTALGSGTVITNQYGFNAHSSLISASNNYGFYGNIPASSSNGQPVNWNLHMNGSAYNYMLGNLLIGSKEDYGYKLQVSGSGASGSLLITAPTLSETANDAYRVGNLIASRSYSAGGTNQTFDIFSIGQNTTSSGAANSTYFFRVNLNGGNSPSGSGYGAAGANNALIQLNSVTKSSLYLTAQNSGLLIYGGVNLTPTITTTANGVSLNLRSDSDSGTAGGGINYYSSVNGASAHSHRWYHNNGEQMRLTYLGNLQIGYTGSLYPTESNYRLAVTGSGASGSLNINNVLYVSGAYVTITSASLNYQQNLSVTSGSYRTISSTPTASYRAAFFDYVIYSGSSNVRAGTVYSIWSASFTEYTETFTNDIGFTGGVSLITAISGSNIELQATSSTSGWTIRSLARLL